MGQEHSRLPQGSEELQNQPQVPSGATERAMVQMDDTRKRSYSNDLDLFRSKKLKLDGKSVLEDRLSRGAPQSNVNKLRLLLESNPSPKLLREQLTKPMDRASLDQESESRKRCYTMPSSLQTTYSEQRLTMKWCNTNPAGDTVKGDYSFAAVETITKNSDVINEDSHSTMKSGSPKQLGKMASVPKSTSAPATILNSTEAPAPIPISTVAPSQLPMSATPPAPMPKPVLAKTKKPKSKSIKSPHLLQNMLEKTLPDLLQNAESSSYTKKFSILYYLHNKNSNKAEHTGCGCESQSNILETLLEKRCKKEVDSESDDDEERPDTPTWLALYDDDADPKTIAAYVNKQKKKKLPEVTRRHTFSTSRNESLCKRRSGSFSGSVLARVKMESSEFLRPGSVTELRESPMLSRPRVAQIPMAQPHISRIPPSVPHISKTAPASITQMTQMPIVQTRISHSQQPDNSKSEVFIKSESDDLPMPPPLIDMRPNVEQPYFNNAYYPNYLNYYHKPQPYPYVHYNTHYEESGHYDNRFFQEKFGYVSRYSRHDLQQGISRNGYHAIPVSGSPVDLSRYSMVGMA